MVIVYSPTFMCFQNKFFTIIIRKMIQPVTVAETLYKIGIACFPIIGYIFQYFLIRRKQRIGTFSIKVCGILLLSATLKIGFYLYEHYSLALLAQAILMITVHLCLLRLCLNVMAKTDYFQDRNAGRQMQQEGGEEGKSDQHFWHWRDKSKYLCVILVGAVLIFILSEFAVQMKENIVGKMTGHILGYSWMIVETTILLPQLHENISQSKVEGVSYVFVALNTLQDLNELIFVSVTGQPVQFILLNSIQVFVDVTLALQIVYYKRCKKRRSDELQEESEFVPGSTAAAIEGDNKGERLDDSVGSRTEKGSDSVDVRIDQEIIVTSDDKLEEIVERKGQQDEVVEEMGEDKTQEQNRCGEEQVDETGTEEIKKEETYEVFVEQEGAQERIEDKISTTEPDESPEPVLIDS